MRGLSYTWNCRRKKQQETRLAGDVSIRRVGARIQLVTPYHPVFASRMRMLGRWRNRSEVWSVPLAQLEAVKDLVREYFGREIA